MPFSWFYTYKNLSKESSVAVGRERTISPEDLAQGLAISHPWETMQDVILVVRQKPIPLLGIMGESLDPEVSKKLDILAWQLDHLMPSLRYVSYAQAEQDCEKLASQLIDQFGRQELKRFRFKAIPRGGLIVLGMLAYTLGLGQYQLEDTSDSNDSNSDVPLVVVDDCSISGNRFKCFLDESQAQKVVFAHLYSHPTLRKNILNREPRVVGCLSAHDLHDYAPERLGGDYASWYQRWTERLGDDCYFFAQPEHVCFAWSEPEFTYWDPQSQLDELGWRMLPPRLCLNSRMMAKNDISHIQYQPEVTGQLKIGDRVLFGKLNNKILVANADTDQCIALQDVAADMWQSIINFESFDDTLAELINLYDVEVVKLRSDLICFIEQLSELGFLKQSDDYDRNHKPVNQNGNAINEGDAQFSKSSVANTH